jgi:hypothetical protein
MTTPSHWGGPIICQQKLEVMAVQTYLSGYVCNLRRTYVLAGKNRVATLDGVRGGAGGVPYTEVATTESAGQADAQILMKTLKRQNTVPSLATNGLSLLFTRSMTDSGHGATRFVYQGGWGGGRCLAITPCSYLGKCGSLAPVASWSDITVHQLNEAFTDSGADRCGRADLSSVAAHPIGRNSPLRRNRAAHRRQPPGEMCGWDSS